LLNSAATMTIMCYALFTVTSGKNPSLVVTLPFVYFAIMHYKRLVIVRGGGEEAEKILLKEYPIIICIFLWLVTYLAICYADINFFR
jgi:hypothetical protein